jgi:Integrase core domain
VLRRLGVGRLPPLTAPPPVRRYERARQGELLHLDIKSLGRIRGIDHRIHGDRRTRVRGIGWEHVHVCIDDHSRLAYAEMLPSARWTDAVPFLERAIAWFAAHGVRTERVMMDNGSTHLAHAFPPACRRLGVCHLRTRPYTPPDQRQSRTLHPDPPPRMGLPPALPQLGPSAACARAVGALLQRAPRPQRAQLPAADYPASGGRGMNNVLGRNN